MNRLFVANKPAGPSSNGYLSELKRKYGVKKAGFSGTLDPFATGVLIIAFGAYTKLFRFLKSSPKSYKATLWLGSSSPAFDTQDISVKNIPSFDFEKIRAITEQLQGELEFIPPRFSAKKINGTRAYKLARQNQDFELLKTKMQVYEAKIISYMHPFLTLDLKVSKGSYIRSYSQLFAKELGCDIALSFLCRQAEGAFVYDGEKALFPLDYLDLKRNFINNEEILENGRKIALKDLKIQEDGDYYIKTSSYFSVISVKNKDVNYQLNKVELC